jgi:lipoprotein-anchoring transpeptidase ErfK/SrfK
MLLVGPSTASAQGTSSALPPWREIDDLPLPMDAASVVVDRDEQPIWSEPSLTSARRGAAMLGVRLPFFAAKRADGCTARWLSVGPEAWICQDALHFDAAAPITAARLAPEPGAPGGLPYRYYFVGSGGSSGYARLEDAGELAPDGELQPGFAVAVVDEGVKDGARYLRTHHGLWVAERDLAPVAPFLFHGAEIAGGELKVAWVVEDQPAVFASPTAARAARATGGDTKDERWQLVPVLEEVQTKSGGWVRAAEGAWLRARDLRKPTLSTPPAAVAPGERWIDVDRGSQTLVAYEGDRPVFATLVSTGKGREGSEDATPPGEFRIWVKLVTSTMDNLEDEQAQRSYAIEDVPYVQYFAKGVGLHGAFWHRGFGRVRSHGCVNLAPLDAQRLFGFTGPHMPAGWAAVLPTNAERGTLVRVR